MKRLNTVFDLDWKPRVVVEASAGTGKTYTIVGIYIRLLLEKKPDVDRILVMTFTNKATSELRGRILARLRECIKVIDTGNAPEDPFLIQVLNQFSGDQREQSLSILKKAVRNFDDSRIFTIHGFCQRVLNEEALHAGVPFDMEIIQHDSLLLEAAEDFWREFMEINGAEGGGELKISRLMKYGKSPRELISSKGLKTLFDSAGAQIEGASHPDPDNVFRDAMELRDVMKREWEQNRDEIEKELLENDLSGFTDRNVTSRCRKMASFLNDAKLKEDTFDQLQYFTSDYVHDEANLKKNKNRLPAELPFFDLCNRYFQMADDLKRAETALLEQVRRDILNRRQDKSIQSGALTYNDLLTTLLDALKNPDRGPGLSEKLLKNYPYALVDEFQDTDTIQYSIFDSIYPKKGEGHSLMMIGDPKQAIYAFRGADVFTYFKAKQEGNPDGWSLGRNFRSTPKLIEAVNRIFDSTGDRPFIEDEITFEPSDAGHPERGQEYLYNEREPVPFRFIAMDGVQSNKGDVKSQVYRQTAVQVRNLLTDTSVRIRDEITNEMRTVNPGDIAVLINSHRDAVQIKKRLKEAGIDSVTYSQEKVFDTFEAKRLEMVMNAVLNPFNRKAVNSALLSGLFGTEIGNLVRISEEEEARQNLVNELQELHETWQRRGFMAMYRSLFHRSDRITQLAVWANSERILMNLGQLADLASTAETNDRLDPSALHSWYLKEMVNPNKSDEQSLLLESDRNLVKISTIHGSKGLQFPVVICATLWEGMESKDMFIRYHKEGSDQLTLNIDRAETPERSEAGRLGKMESIAEDVRKAYVALTRAKYECRVIWATHSQSHLSGLGAAFLGRDKLTAVMNDKVKEEHTALNEDTLLNPIRKAAERYPELIAMKPFSDTEADPATIQLAMKADDLQKRTYSGRSELKVRRRIESFSSLAGHHTEAAEPDYDRITGRYVDSMMLPDTPVTERSVFTFPKGPVAGTAIHKLFEHEDFRFDTAAKDDHSKMIPDVLDSYGIGEEWTGVARAMIRDVAGADLGELALHLVKPSDELREMEFNFPVGKPDSEELYRIIRNKTGSSFETNKLEQYLTGFIDLIVRQNGKFYILDYKSNYLGDTPEDYSREAIEGEMKAAGYDLQYHIYTVALKKYLEQRMPDFAFDKDFGGVYYLFVRGMRRGEDTSYFFDKPASGVILELEQYLGGE